MLFVLAPAPYMVFVGAPSGATYQANQFGIIFIASANSADQTYLVQSGCAPLTPFGSYTPPTLSAWKLAATGCAVSTANTLTGANYVNKSTMAVRSHTATAALSGVIKLVYSNWTAQSSAGDYYDTGSTGFGAITGTCSIAYPNKSTIIGTGSFVIQPGQNVQVAITLSATIPAGAQFWIGTYAVPATGCGIPLNSIVTSPTLNSTSQSFVNASLGEAANCGTTGVTDQTANLSGVTSNNANVPCMWGPVAILSLQPASTPVACVFSDSRNSSYYYQTNPRNSTGWFAQALEGVGVPTINFGGAGHSAGVEAGNIIAPCPLQGQSAITLRKQLAQLIGVTDAYIDLGINDMGDAGPIAGAATAATVEGYWTTIVNQLTALGLRITAGTLLPITTSTDSWATTANQTLSPNNAQMDTFNTWVRAKPLGISFVVDGGFAVSGATASAKWNVGAGGAAPWTADGVHPYDRALNNLLSAVTTANYTSFVPATSYGYADTYARGLKTAQSALDFALNPQNMGHDILLGSLLGANFNSTADQTIALSGPSQYVITNVVVANPSVSLTAAQGAVYAGAAKTGPLLGMTTTTPFSALTNSPPILGLIQAIKFGLASTGMSYRMSGAQNIYLSLTTAQGAAATADVYVFGKRLGT